MSLQHHTAWSFNRCQWVTDTINWENQPLPFISLQTNALTSQAAAHQHVWVFPTVITEIQREEKVREEREDEESLRSWDEVSGWSVTMRLTTGQSHFGLAEHGFKDAAHLGKPGMSTHQRLASGLCCPSPGTHSNSAAVSSEGIISAAAVEPHPPGALGHSPQKESSRCCSVLSSLLLWLPGSLVQN